MLVYLNGEFLDATEARISVFDRGFLFGDAVYEVTRFYDGRGLRLEHHLDRLRRSLDAIHITAFDVGALQRVSFELLDRTGMRDASVYWQVSRGVQPEGRRHLPKGPISAPTVFAWAEPELSLDECETLRPMKAIARPDTRWWRCDIKSTNLLANLLLKMEAAACGADEAIQHLDGLITEGASTNILVVTESGEIATPPLNHPKPILPGITRRLALDACPEIIERPIALEELLDAREIVLVGTRTMMAPVVELDGAAVGEGTIGPVARRLAEQTFALARREIGVFER